MNPQDSIDILAIGDIVTDCFIRLKDAEAYCDLDQENCKLCLRFGDKVPFEFVEIIRGVGNSANAAVAGARLGLKTALMATVGNDQNGKDCIASLTENNVSIKYIEENTNYPTNYHYVLWYDVERTILVKHAPFPHSFPEDMPAPKWIYLTSISDNSLPYHNQIAEYILKHPETKLCFQPGTFQINFGTEQLKNIYALTELFICNIEEAQKILKTTESDKIKLLGMIRTLGPKIVVLTDGIKGAYASDGTHSYFMPIYPHEPYERTGAGDAFSSTIVSCLVMSKSLEEALLWAPINSMSVVQQIGAQKGLLGQEEIKKYLTQAPENYKLKEY